MKHAALLTKDGDCIDPSVNFADFTYELLPNVITSTVTREDFSPCEYVQDIQEALNFTNSATSDVSFADLVTLSGDLEEKLRDIFGSGVQFTGEWLLDQFGSPSVFKLLNFIGNLFTDNSNSPENRRLKGGAVPYHKSEAMKRGGVMRAVRNAAAPRDLRRGRRLQEEEEPLFALPLLGDLLTLTFDFNFGDGQKSLLFGVDFSFDSDDTAGGSIEDLFKSFLSETVGSNANDDLGGFSFSDAAAELARGKICLGIKQRFTFY